MDDAHAASEAARALSRQRWGNTVAVRAASTVIERADQLDADTRAEVLHALARDGDDGR